MDTHSSSERTAFPEASRGDTVPIGRPKDADGTVETAPVLRAGVRVAPVVLAVGTLVVLVLLLSAEGYYRSALRTPTLLLLGGAWVVFAVAMVLLRRVAPRGGAGPVLGGRERGGWGKGGGLGGRRVL